ncbi:hypothetical protein GQR58_004728 [Nymphon striatum]|nr:hypothetical protein GQR58_004728 [Nymphon striatum]
MTQLSCQRVLYSASLSSAVPPSSEPHYKCPLICYSLNRFGFTTSLPDLLHQLLPSIYFHIPSRNDLPSASYCTSSRTLDTVLVCIVHHSSYMILFEVCFRGVTALSLRDNIRDWEPEIRQHITLGWQDFGHLNNVWRSKLSLLEAEGVRPMCPASTNVWVRDLDNCRRQVRKLACARLSMERNIPNVTRVERPIVGRRWTQEQAIDVPLKLQFRYQIEEVEKGETEEKYEDMSKDELVNQVKKQFALLAKSKQKIDGLSKTCMVLKKQNEEKSSDDISKFIQECDKLGNDNEELKQKLQIEVQEKNGLVKQLQANVEEINCLEMKMHTLTATCQVLTDDVSSLQNSLKVPFVNLYEEKQRTDDLQIKLDDADSTIENMNVQSSERQELQAKFKEMISETEMLKKQNDTYVIQLNEDSSKNVEFCNEIKTLEGKLESKNFEFQQLLQNFESTKADFQKCETAVIAVEGKNSDANTEILKLTEKLQSMLTSENMYKETIHELKQEKNGIQASLKTDSNDSVEIENDWQNKVRELEQLLSTVQEEKDDLETKLKNYEHEKQEINSRLEALESETMDKVTEIGQSDLEAELEHKISEIEYITANLEELSKINEDLRQKVDRDENEQLESNEKAVLIVSKLEDRICSLMAEKGELQLELTQGPRTH